ncbi:S24 family peptidase [Pectobacterium zantedeschiae]|uniref:XRE family transcriptional regulator n=1 Tax=Pectobacterium zantedeschiae TaxID=2034769 RepID=UPI0032EB9338
MNHSNKANVDEKEKPQPSHPSQLTSLGCGNFHDRLKSLLAKFKSVNAFATSAGVSVSGLNRLLEGGYPTLPILISVANAGGVSVQWLATGEDIGNAALNNAFEQHDKNTHDVLGNPVDVEEFSFIPRYDVRAAAGHGALNETETPKFSMAFRKYWIKNFLNADPHHLFVITVDGSSLEGTLNDGDNILVNGADTDPKEGVYVLRVDGHLLVKLVQRVPGGLLKVSSTNTAYEPFTVDMNNQPADFAIIGRVVWFGRTI